jgi:hypothetical protein
MVVIQLELPIQGCIYANRVTHVINDVLLGIFLVCTRHVNRADDVDLVVFERYVPFIHVYDVICVVYPESETDKNKIILTQHNIKIQNGLVP